MGTTRDEKLEGKVLIETCCITFYIHFGIMGIRRHWLNHEMHEVNYAIELQSYQSIRENALFLTKDAWIDGKYLITLAF
jgi:hypothetical protein